LTVLLQALLLVNALPADAGGAPPDPTSQEVLARYFRAEASSSIRGVTMESTFYAKVPSLDKDASLVAKRTVSPTGEIQYETIRTAGDKGIIKDVIARIMTAEQEIQPAHFRDASVNEANYKFKHKAVVEKDGHITYVFEVTPKKKRPGLFKGDIWVDKDTGLVIREAGRLVKSPSIVIKKVEFVREYELKDQHSMPLRTRSISDTRLWGKAEVSVLYTNWEWSSPQPALLILPQERQ
jgi:hypothetical protein